MRAPALFVVVALLAACLANAGAAPSVLAPQLWLNRSILAETPRSWAIAHALAAPSGPYAIIQLRGP